MAKKKSTAKKSTAKAGLGPLLAALKAKVVDDGGFLECSGDPTHQTCRINLDLGMGGSNPGCVCGGEINALEIARDGDVIEARTTATLHCRPRPRETDLREGGFEVVSETDNGVTIKATRGVTHTLSASKSVEQNAEDLFYKIAKSMAGRWPC